MTRALLAAAVLGGLVRVAAAEPVPCDADDDCGAEQHVGALLSYGVSEAAGVSRMRTAAPSAGDGWTFQIGFRLRRRLHLVLQLAAIDDLAYSPDPTLLEEHHAALVGVRWMPFRGRRDRRGVLIGRYFDPAALTVNASVGGGSRDRYTPTTDASTYAPVVSAAIGYLPLQGDDWALGAEWREQVERYPEGIQHGYAFSVVGQLNL